MMSNRCLVFVPHPDDEVIIAGGIIPRLLKVGYDVTIVIVTYGDFNPALASTRVKETIAAQKILGYQKLLFLGYGDGYQGTHIYNTTDENGVALSMANRKETYCISTASNYHFLRTGEQCSYTRLNLKNDIRNIIFEILPELLICVDTDKNPEHRVLSLLFDEVIGESVCRSNYRPIILKKFAYLGCWAGADDFFSSQMKVTLPGFYEDSNRTYSESSLFSYPYSWKERISIESEENDYNPFFWKSRLFKAISAHRSQSPNKNFLRISNKDIVYWYRSIDGLQYEASVSASSGVPSCLNNFKITDTSDINEQSISIQSSSLNAWIPDKSDTCKCVRFQFANSVDIGYISVFQSYYSKISQIMVTTDGGFKFCYDVNDCISHIAFQIPKQYGVNSISLSFKSYYNEPIIIHELEIYSQEPSFPWKSFPLKQYHPMIGDRRNYLLLLFCSFFYKIYSFFVEKKRILSLLLSRITRVL